MGLLVVGGTGVWVLTGWDINAGPGELGWTTDDDGGATYEATDTDADWSDDSSGTEPYDTTGSYDNGWSDGPSDGLGRESAPPATENTTSVGYVVLPYAEPWTGGVEDTFDAYFAGINEGDPQRAWQQLSGSRQEVTSLDEFADAVRTSQDGGFVVREASYASGRAQVWLEFTSTQDPALGPDGEGCTMWSLDYVLVEQSDGTFLIDEVAGHGGTSGHTPC